MSSHHGELALKLAKNVPTFSSGNMLWNSEILGESIVLISARAKREFSYHEVFQKIEA